MLMNVMAPVPILMVLYSSDAVEIRYTDGSFLELSPCGSAMIHHEAPDQREHLRHGQSKKIQKRTRFVTSEHKDKVLQALDFRNRFAERPYLCEDLLPKDDIVALYARIESIAWPRLLDEAKVEVLADGSRRITSLDEYATLIVSPHGHDFTVCYLSKTSEDQSKTKGLLAQKSDSSSSCHPSLAEPCSYEPKCLLRSNEAVVHPFETTDLSPDTPVRGDQLAWDIDHSSDTPVRGGQFACGVDYSHIARDFNKIQEFKTKNIQPETNMKPELLRSQSDNLATQNVIPAEQIPETKKFYMQETEVNVQNSLHNKTDRLNRSTQTIDIQSNERYLTESNNKHYCLIDAIPKEQKHKPSIPFSQDSPGPHDISSISRSSTPDGLRTTIDSDATLTQENILESFQEQPFVHKLRHSSPTQYTSSPYELNSKIPEKVLTNLEVSLSSSYLGNQKSPMQHEQNKYINIKQMENKSSIVRDCSSTTSVDNFELKETVAKQVKSDSHNNYKSDSLNTVKVTTQTDADFNLNNTTLNEVRKLDFEYSSLHINFATEAHSSSRAAHSVIENCSELQMNKRENTDKQNRGRYVWTTNHCSRNECPIMWTHPLKLALGGTHLTNEHLSSRPTLRRLQAVTTTFNASEQKCMFTTVPASLPVTCPFQHSHKCTLHYKDVENESSGCYTGEFQHGKLKIVISEGIVYRLCHRPDMTVIEIHPGDGSVLVSQGVKAHFFTHYVLVEDQLEERTYSLKSMPHHKLNGMYSIKKLIDTANRFLLMNNGWEQRGIKEDIPCWKKEVIAVVEPLSSSLLEECTVEGLGTFSAFTNGRVRIVFEDRTALDMVCNFSQRVQECFQHSQEAQVSLPCASSVSPPMATFESIFGRLLLPSGEYVTVDINKPGLYRKYIQAAQEWAEWVRASPLERHHFYSHHQTPAILQQTAELELKKIFCFNYILEQTMLMLKDKTTESTNQSSAQAMRTHEPEITSKLQPSDYQSTTVRSHSNTQSDFSPLHREQSYVSHHQRGSFNNAVAQSSPTRTMLTSVEPTGSTLQSLRTEIVANRILEESDLGFHSVKEVLLQNSKLINDIEQFLETIGKS